MATTTAARKCLRIIAPGLVEDLGVLLGTCEGMTTTPNEPIETPVPDDPNAEPSQNPNGDPTVVPDPDTKSAADPSEPKTGAEPGQMGEEADPEIGA